ncbi:MAG: hypothetical protein GDA52_09335 [Rhodobacteraceae bacterium]|nr:hypothetical protein [Paracoccaceae bacterium]
MMLAARNLCVRAGWALATWAFRTAGQSETGRENLQISLNVPRWTAVKLCAGAFILWFPKNDIQTEASPGAVKTARLKIMNMAAHVTAALMP